MVRSELDLRRLGAGEAPRRRRRRRGRPRRSRCADRSRGCPPSSAVLLKAGRTAEVPVSWEPPPTRTPPGWRATWASAPASPGSCGLVRDDHGGVLLHHGRIEADGDGRRALSRRLGLQAHHDDIRVADGEITRIDVRPDWTAVDTIGVTVMLQPLRPTPAHQRPGPAGGLRPGADRPGRRPVPAAGQRWTWYADDRVRWLLHP